MALSQTPATGDIVLYKLLVEYPNHFYDDVALLVSFVEWDADGFAAVTGHLFTPNGGVQWIEGAKEGTGYGQWSWPPERT